MAQMSDVYDNALIKWNDTNHLMEGEAVIVSAVASKQLETTVEDSGVINTATSDQAYMFISDTSELQTLSAGIFSPEHLTGEAAASVEQAQNSSVLQVLSETNVQRFAGTTEHGNLSRVEQQEGLVCSAVEPSPSMSVKSTATSHNPHPLGSSQNPIRIIQQGNKYTSMQELSPEQLNQIMQVQYVQFVHLVTLS